MTARHALGVSALLIASMRAGPMAHATPIEISVDTGLSTVNVQYCLGTSCSTDTSAVEGTTLIRLDSVAAPTMIQQDDFFYALTETINIAITGLTATGTNITLDYATPGLPQGPMVLGPGGMFSFLDVPANQSGMINYAATGTTCFLLTLAGFPCTDAIDLAQQGSTAGDIAGTVTVLPGRVVRLTSQPNISGPINPANPALGTLTITGTIVGEAVVPRRADVDQNGLINGADIQGFVETLLSPDTQSWQRRYATDMDDDDEFDLLDAALFLDCVLNESCPE